MALIRLRGCACWSAPLIIASNKVRVSRIEAYMMLKPMLLATRFKSIDGTFVKTCKLQAFVMWTAKATTLIRLSCA